MSWKSEIEAAGEVVFSWTVLIEPYDSPIEGRGLRTVQYLPENFVLGEVVGPRFLASEHDSRTCVEAGDDVIEPTTEGVPVHWMNHSCSPNCYVEEDTELGAACMLIKTGRNILPGEEVTIDYMWDDLPEPFPVCRCGSPNCRGWVLSSSALKKVGLLNTPLL